MFHDLGRFAKKIIASLLFAIFLSFSCAAAYARSPGTADKKKKSLIPNYDEQIETLHVAFTGLYWDLWARHNLTTLLYDCVSQVVKEYEGWKAYADDEDYAVAQEKINKLFSGHYNVFLSDLQKRFETFFSEQVLTYYWDRLVEALEKTDDPSIMERLKNASDEFLKMADPELGEAATKKANNDGSFTLSSIRTIGAFLYQQLGGAEYISSIAEEVGLSAIAGSALGEGLGALLSSGAIPLIVITYNLGQEAVKVVNGDETMRNGLYDPMLRHYLYAVPEMLWQPIVNPVRNRLQNIYTEAVINSAKKNS